MKLQDMDPGLLPVKDEILLCVPALPHFSWFGVRGTHSAEDILLPMGFFAVLNFRAPQNNFGQNLVFIYL